MKEKKGMAIRGIHSFGYSAIVAVVVIVGGVGYLVIVVVALDHIFSDVLDGFVVAAVDVVVDDAVVVAVVVGVGGVPVRT